MTEILHLDKDLEFIPRAVQNHLDATELIMIWINKDGQYNYHVGTMDGMKLAQLQKCINDAIDRAWYNRMTETK